MNNPFPRRRGSPAARLAWFRSFHRSQGATLIAGVLLTLAALLLSALIWESATPVVDDRARPAPAMQPRGGKTPAVPGDESRFTRGRKLKAHVVALASAQQPAEGHQQPATGC